MSILNMVLMIGAIALVWTAVVAFGFRAHKNLLISFLQSFTGALFVFSGAVKAIDPLGTAYKMEQYFAEFESAFSGSMLPALAPLFPKLANASESFSVIMIVFEIVLGIMLLIGARTKLTAWLFFLLVVFFIILTGFTFLTGYVPSGVNFFDFAKWGEFQQTNMKVTDCGCFGDFVKFKPQISFYKDLILFVPAIIFLFTSKKMHRLFTPLGRTAVVWLSIIGLTLYCWSNYIWNEPDIDFRPFKEGANIAEQRRLEGEAQADVKIISYTLTNKSSGQVIELPYEEYMKKYADYPKEQWEFDPVKTEPTIPATKISEFDIEDQDGNYMTEEILEEQGYSLMIVAYDLHSIANTVTTTTVDSIFIVDTVKTTVAGKDSITFVKKLEKVSPKQESVVEYTFDGNYLDRFTEKVNPVMEAAGKAGWKVYAITKVADPLMIENFRHAAQCAYPFYVADDILLKTIIRSNPGILLWKGGVIVEKWHYKRLPKAENILEKYQ